MRTRIALLVVAVLACVVFNNIIEVGQPTLDASIAVQQLEDTEASALAMRSFSRFTSSLPLFSYGAVALFGLLLFWGNISRFAKTALDPES